MIANTAKLIKSILLMLLLATAAHAEPNWDYTLDGYCRWKIGIELHAQPTAAQFIAFNNCRAMMMGMLVVHCLGNSTIVTERITDCIDEYVEGIAPVR